MAGGLAASTVCADDVFDFEGYSAAPLAGQMDPVTMNSWETESTTDGVTPSNEQPPVVVTGVNSPRTAGNSAVMYDLSGSGLSDTQVGIDLTQQYGSGIVQVSYDFFRGDLRTPDNRPLGGGAPGRNQMNLQLYNKPIVGLSQDNTGFGGTADKLFAQYHRHVWTEKLAAPKVFGSLDGGAFGFINDFHELDSEVFGSFSEAAETWMHIEMYFDYSNPNGELIYSAIYHINSDGSLRKLSERRSSAEAGNTITLNPTAVGDAAGAGIAAIQIGMNIGQAFSAEPPSDIDQVWYVDNVAVRSTPGFVAPPAMDQLPPPVARPPQQSNRQQTLQAEVDILGGGGFAAVGDNPSLEVIGNTLYTFDNVNFLFSWDLGTGTGTFMSPPSNINSDANVGIMTKSSDDTKLYFTSTSPAGEWAALYSYDIATMSDGGVPVYNAYQRNFGDGQHSAVTYTVPGEADRVLAAWRGAQFFDSYSADGTSAAGGLGGVGNRWDGGCGQAETPDSVFVLLRTEVDGSRSPTQAQAVQNGIYRATFGPGGSVGLFEPVSPSRQVLPWDPACADGPCLGTHRMQYVPQTNSIWVVRGSGTNEIGVYDIDTDDWRVVQLFYPGGDPIAMDRTDIELVGDRMYILNRGDSFVYSADVINLGAAPTGACCNAGVCTIEIGSDCTDAGGTYLGDGTSCEDYGEPVVSTGGMVEDISGTGTSLRTAAAMGDDTTHLRAIGFSFDYYGTTYTDVYVNSNGFLSFEAPASDFYPGPLTFPDSGGTNALMTPFLFDWNPDASVGNDGVTKPGDVFEEVRGAVGSRRYIVQWNEVSQYDGAGYILPHTFQVILYEATGEIEYRYGALDAFLGGTLGGTPSIGLENQTGSAGQQVFASTGLNNPGIESNASAPFGAIDGWGPNGGWADHAGFAKPNNGTLGANFGFYSLNNSESVGQVLPSAFEPNTSYNFASWGQGGGNDVGTMVYEIGYDDGAGNFVLLASAEYAVGEAWEQLAGVDYTTGAAGPEIGEPIWVRLGPASSGGGLPEDVWFDEFSVSPIGGPLPSDGTQILMQVGPCPAATCLCEYTGDSPASVDIFDLLLYLDFWFAGDPEAEVDGTPPVDIFDLLLYLDCWFPASAGAPCP